MRLESADVREADDGRKWVVVSHEGSLEMIPIQGVVSYAETLGYDNAVDAVEAACKYSAEVGGEFPCEEQYLILEERERAREEEADRCVKERQAIADYDRAVRGGCTREEARSLAKKLPVTPDPRSPQLRGALAGRKAVLALNGAEKDSDSVLVKAQSEARRKVKALTPVKNPSSASRHKPLSCDETPHCTEDDVAKHFFDNEGRRKIADALRDHSDEVQRCREGLMHVLSRRQENPFNEVGDGRQRLMRVDDLKKKYGGTP